jgi:RNA polymerase-interacting CarD/CdnL/TRCF family regulator
MTLTIGDKVIYPSQGPCVVGAIVKKVVAGRPIKFYHLTIMEDRGGELFVPVDKIQAIGIRQLLEKSEIPKLFGQLTTTVHMNKDWKQRAHDILKLFASGSAFDMVEIVKSLTMLRETKTLSFRENLTLERARKLLICEISEVMGETKSAVEDQVNQILNARKSTDLSEVPTCIPIGKFSQAA